MTSNMHDWMLENVEVDWPSGCVSLRLSGYNEHANIIAQKFLSVIVPKKENWGPSVSVNTMKWTKLDNGATVLSIEMQTGDVVEITAGSIDVSLSSKEDGVL